MSNIHIIVQNMYRGASSWMTQTENPTLPLVAPLVIGTFILGNYYKVVVREKKFFFWYLKNVVVITNLLYLYYFSDTRVKGWFLLDNYIPTFICSTIYLLIVWLGPKYMKNRQPLACRRILVVYNLGLTLLSLYMFCEVGLRLPRASSRLTLLILQSWIVFLNEEGGRGPGRASSLIHFENVWKLIFQMPALFALWNMWNRSLCYWFSCFVLYLEVK